MALIVPAQRAIALGSHASFRSPGGSLEMRSPRSYLLNPKLQLPKTSQVGPWPVLRWLEHSPPPNPLPCTKVAGSVPNQGTYRNQPVNA